MYFFPVRCCLLSLAMGRLKDSNQSLSLLLFIYYIHMCQRVGHDFIVVICTCRPDLIDYDMLSPGSHIDNLNNAFHVAEQHLGLPQLLDAEGSYIVELFYLPCICVYIHVIVHRQCDERLKCTCILFELSLPLSLACYSYSKWSYKASEGESLYALFVMDSFIKECYLFHLNTLVL